ncbi:transglutaminase N-terminal domain-containing protein [Phenylobacterium sp.]|uniref:transglutaminase family protein n=1 Tax=Phenylobacterium sp. TaxID=1871053 RepID=UPI0035B1814E
MIYSVFHRTTYAYEDAVTFARCVLRLTPRTTASQTVLQSAITVIPRPSQTLERAGPFGERMLTVTIEEPHTTLVIEAIARVDVHAAPVTDLADSPPWEAVRTASFATIDISPESPAAYLYSSTRAPVVPAITDYARQSFPPGRPILEAAFELTRRLTADFIYDAEATDVGTPVDAAFAARRGVCQDFTHIMISALRGLGLPASYVSGYLRTIPPPGKPRLEGADATHAWVDLWCGDVRGWIGFDPTNALIVQNDHIVLAIGRDYADVAPIDGVLLASGDQAIKVEVDVVPEPDALAATPAFEARASRSA